MPSLTLFRLDIQLHLQKNLYPNRNWIWVSSPPYPKALKRRPLLLCSPSLCQWHTSHWSSIQCKYKKIFPCYYLHWASLIFTHTTAPTASHPQPIPDHLSLHLCILNCQFQSNLWNILEVTVYGGRGDNIFRPLWRTGTRQCVLNNINCWKRAQAGALAEEQAGETDREWAERGNPVFWGGVGVIETMWASPSGGIREETELSQPQDRFN